MAESVVRRHEQRTIAARRSGYVLIMTLVLISISCVLLAGFARRSLLLAMEASQAQVDLQRRWGMLSVQRAVLGRAGAILDKQATAPNGANPPWPHPPQVACVLRLGGLDFDILLADEEAKVNLNAAYRQGQGRGTVNRLIHQMNRGAVRLPVQLRPSRSPTVGGGDTAGRVAFHSWGQVFALERPPRRASAPDALRQATAEISCWGSGRLNVRRASDRAVQETCRLVGAGGSAGRLLQLRRRQDNPSLETLLRQLALPRRQNAQLSGLLTDQSQTHSVWLRIASDRSRWHTLLIGSGPGGRGITRFSW